MKIYFLIGFIIYFTNVNAQQYQFGEKVKIHDLGESEFYEISQFDIWSDTIFVADRAGKKVYLFDFEGKFINSSGRDGRGPGEFPHGPKLIVPMNEFIYAVDGTMPYLYEYDLVLNFLKNNDEDHAGLRSSDKILRTDSKIYMTKYPGHDHTISIFDLEYETLEEIDLSFKIEAGVLNRFELLAFDSVFLLAWYNQNRFEIYDLNFNKLEGFTIKGIKDIADGVYAQTPIIPQHASGRQAEVLKAGAFAPAGSFFEGFVALDENHFMVQLGYQTGGNENARIVNLTGEIVQEIPLPESGKILAYSNQTLFIIDGLHVVAYEFYN